VKSYYDITGDGGSDVVGQIQALGRQIDAALAGVRRIVAVGSGKGGVGKSTVTMALAHALARAGRRVTILDADLNGPSQARLAGLEGRPWIPGDHGLVPPRRPDGIGVVSLGSLLAEAAPLEFDTVSSGEQQTWRATRELAMFSQILAATDWGELDVLLLDLPPGTERTVQFAEMLAGASGAPPDSPSVAFVLVTVPSAVSRGVVARSLSALRDLGAPVLGVVENMAGYYCADCGAVKPLFPETESGSSDPWKAECLGRIPFDPELAARCDRGWPQDAARPREGDDPSGALAVLDSIARRLVPAPNDSVTVTEPDTRADPVKEVPR
jgi:ATP-binding protein involved in chromosome partitioning